MIKILIADHHEITRFGLFAILEQNKNFKVIAQAEHGKQAIELCNEYFPDIILMEVAMPILNGIEATKLIKETNHRVNIIMISMHKEKRYVLETLKAGALGYLLKDSTKEEVIEAVEDVYSGRNYLSPKITEVIVDDFLITGEASDSTVFRILSGREREVLQAIAEGYTTREIAQNLEVSPKTIETHRKSIMDKLNLYSIAKLTKYAIKQGITDIE